MITITRAIPCVAALLLTFIGAQCQQDPSVLLVSFDGFRHDYIDKYDLRNFKEFREGGASAEGLIPCYPGLTFPNHYSIVTGQRPGNHGLIDNSFYDSAFNISYTISNRAAVTDDRFYGGMPLWSLARAAGLKTASYFWVGSEVDVESKRPDISYEYDAKVPFKSRIDTVVSWLRKDAKARPRFITLYFSEPDHTAHGTGPESQQTRAMLLSMDSLLGYMMREIESTKSPVNTILVSDHGMSELVVADETYVFLDELYNVKSEKVRTVVSSTLAHIYAGDRATIDSLFTLLKAREQHFTVYRKPEFPAHWHYNHYRAGNILVVADPGYYIRHSGRAAFNQRVKQGARFGVHGYDPEIVPDMYGIFMAEGPQIKKARKLGLVRNIDIYPLIALILSLEVQAIDGDPRALEKIYSGR